MRIALSPLQSRRPFAILPTATPSHNRRCLSRCACPVMFVWLLGCSTSSHGSRGRDPEDPAMLITTMTQAESGYSTEITKVDGRHRGWSSYTLVPGRHSVEVIGKHDSRSPMDSGVMLGLVGAAIASGREAWVAGESPLLTACFIARPGHTYEVRTLVEGGVWKVEVFDHETTYTVQSPCKRAPYEQPRR
jgi:hypothetical protein